MCKVIAEICLNHGGEMSVAKELIKQAKEIEERVKLAELIYSQDLNFKPVLLKHYYLYDKGLSLIGPSEWNHEHLGEFLFIVKQLGDGTWQKI